MAKRKPKVSDQLRGLIETCGISQYELAKLTHIDQSALSRFMSGQRGLSSKALDRLGEYLNLKITIDDKLQRKRSK